MTFERTIEAGQRKIFTGQVSSVTEELGDANYVHLTDGEVSHVIEIAYLPGEVSFWRNLIGTRVRITVDVKEDN